MHVCYSAEILYNYQTYTGISIIACSKNLKVTHYDVYCTAQEKGNTSNELVAGTAAYVLLLPGKVLDISALKASHKFRGRGNKEGPVAAIQEL